MSDKIFSKVKYFMGLDSEEEMDENEVVENAKNFQPEIKEREVPKRGVTPNKNMKEPKVMSMNNMTEKVNVTILKPEDFNDSAIVVNNLKAEKPVIVNLEAVEQETARKIFDFCSGALYALNGKIYKVSRNIFLMAPENVDISGNLKNSVDSEFEME